MTVRLEHHPHWPTGHATTRQGFTLVELLVVCSVIIALMAIGFPILFMAKKNAARTATINLVEGIAAAVSTYGTRSWSWTESGTSRTAMLWDLNGGTTGTTDRYADRAGYGEIDGNPAAGETLPSAIETSGYIGLLDMAQPAVGKQFVNAKRQIVDAWGEPLLISYPVITNDMSAAQQRAELLRYGSDGFQVWSKGPDREPGTADDIRHGEQNDED